MHEAATGVMPYSDRARNVALAHTVLDMSYNEADLAKAIASVGTTGGSLGDSERNDVDYCNNTDG
jgi:hypothetical protein